MIVKSVYETDVRVRREAGALVDAGYTVTVICLGPDARPPDGVTVVGTGQLSGLKRSQGRPDGAVYRLARWALLPTHRRLSNLQFAGQVRAAARRGDVAPDIIHAHDFTALQVGAELARNHDVPLIYDSHEVSSGMIRHGRPTPLRNALDRRAEARLAHQASAVVTIGEGAARILRERLGVSDITIVRNTFPSRSGLGPPQRPSGAVYAGRVSQGRDLETVFAADVWNNDLSLHLIGPDDGSVEVPDWAITHETGTIDEVDRLVVDAGIVLVPLTAGPVNHLIALPNKLFQSISVGVPVVAADLPEMAAVVREHGLGHLYEPGDPDSLSRAVQSVVEEYPALCANVALARQAFDWSTDGSSLIELYRSVVGDSPR